MHYLIPAGGGASHRLAGHGDEVAAPSQLHLVDHHRSGGGARGVGHAHQVGRLRGCLGDVTDDLCDLLNAFAHELIMVGLGGHLHQLGKACSESL